MFAFLLCSWCLQVIGEWSSQDAASQKQKQVNTVLNVSSGRLPNDLLRNLGISREWGEHCSECECRFTEQTFP